MDSETTSLAVNAVWKVHVCIELLVLSNGEEMQVTLLVPSRFRGLSLLSAHKGFQLNELTLLQQFIYAHVHDRADDKHLVLAVQIFIRTTQMHA